MKFVKIMSMIALVAIAVNLTIQTIRSGVGLPKEPKELVEKTSVLEVIGTVSGDFTPHGAVTRGLLAKEACGSLTLIPFKSDGSTFQLERMTPKLVKVTRYGNYTGYSPLFYEKE